MNLNEVLEALFDCSAIGNVRSGHYEGTRFTTKFRNRYAKFNPNEEIVLHKSLQKGLNITG
jgi:hypothetical protein